MADRVWFATRDYRLFTTFTRNVNSSKFSGFPVRVVDNDGSAVGSGTRYPIGMTADEAMELCWRVKLMTIDTDGLIDDGLGNQLAFMDVTLGTDPATRERDIITIARVRSGETSGSWFGLDYYISHSIQTFFNDATWTGCYKVGSTYYPYLTLESRIHVESPPSVNDLVLSLLPVSSAYYMGNFSGTFGPHTVTYYWAYDDPIVFPHTLSYYDISFDSYWPYAASDGTPIYNTSTGALLQNPRN